MRKPLTLIGLQIYALALALVATMGGVRTDEAKYLLNIPYPHPPLARLVLESTYGLPWNELLWRIVFATAIVHAVWLVVRLPRKAGVGAKVLLAGAWLLSGAVVLQAPTIMMAPLTALSGLVLLYASSRTRSAFECFLVALLWLASLFIAYQSVLFLPVVIGILLRSGSSKSRTALYALGPILALGLYTFANPLALQSIIGLGGGASVLFPQKVSQFGLLWLLAGSGVVSVIGTAGVLLSRRMDWILTLLLVSAYITLSYHDYYGIFLVPLFVVGLASLFDRYAHALHRLDGSLPLLLTIGVVGCVSAVGATLTLVDSTNPARDTMQALKPNILALGRSDIRVMIVGDFGHEWQYYTLPTVRELVKYAPAITVPDADVVVCWSACPVELLAGKERLPNAPTESWIRRDVTLRM